ncbi:MAG: hydantoinase/oxoprolinase family protein [Pseudomonadota bacterium]
MVGVDVGGTFTDLFWLDAEGNGHTAKVPSVRANQALGIRAGLDALLCPPEALATIVHGTTVGTNALLERRGAATGVITTTGFKDLLEMRRRDRPQTWGLWGQFEPVIPRDMRLEVDERVLADGTVLEAVDSKAVQAAAKSLLERGARALCIFFINSYANAANEQAAAQAAAEVWPNDHISVASQILPEIREFERASTASLNAYLQPVVGDYLEHLDGGLRDNGFAGQLLVVQSSGGVMTAATARANPVRTALSGPAAGVIAAGQIASTAGFRNVITCDMGGTSFDVAVIADGDTNLTAQTSVDFGLVIRTPMVEMTTIGAGGGSIAWVDRSGLLQIGPESAGSDPGPACYGNGNPRPTVTDANVMLGRINSEQPIGGRATALDRSASERALITAVGEPLGLNALEAAEAVIRVANARMAGAIRLVSIERGHDPGQFVAMPFGGAGGLHVGALVREVGLAGALVPRYPGVTSALGCVMADMRHDRVHTINSLLDSLDIGALDAEMLESARQDLASLNDSGVPFDGRETRFELDMLYVGQTHTLAVHLPLPNVDAGTTHTGVTGELIRAAFVETYTRTFGRPLEGLGVRVMNLRTSVIGRRPRFDLTALAPSARGTTDGARTGSRKLWAAGTWHDAGVYDRLTLPAGAVVTGPAVLEQADATTYIDPGMCAEVDAPGNLVVRPTEPA